MKETLLAILRQILTAVGGILAGKGYVDGAEVEIIVGGAVALASAVWMLFVKKKDVAAAKELAEYKGA